MTKGMIFIKDQFKKSGMTAHEFGRKIGVSGTTLTNWINGKSTPNLAVFEQALDILGYEPCYVSKEEAESAKKRSFLWRIFG